MSIGSDLKTARESRKISLDTISKRTKIPAKYLESLEQNNFEIFPSHTYAKGFIRAYARVVGLDPAVLTRQFNAEVQPIEVRIQPKNIEAELEKNLGWRPTLERPAVFRKPDEGPDLALEMVEEEPLRQDPSVRRRRDFTPRRGKWGPWAGRAAAGFLTLVLAGAAVFYGVKWIGQVKWNAPKPETGMAENPVYQPVPVADKYQHLILKGLDKSWVQVSMDDGQSNSEVDLDQGETKTYKALKNFKVKVGNAGGVQIQFNGKFLGILGAVGQVVEIQLPPDSNGDIRISDNNS